MFSKQILPNNLRVFTSPMEGVKSVTAMILVGAGSRYEDWRISGISHFAEHMFFKGTTKRPTALDISSVIDGFGGEFNAFTSKEYTGYYVKASSSNLETALDVLSDMLLNSKFDQAEIDRERGVILEEMRMYLDMPMRHISTVYESLLFGDHPLGWDIVGHIESINEVNHNDFVEYIGSLYDPSNMILGVAGNTDEVKVRELGNKYLGGLVRKQTRFYKDIDLTQKKKGIKISHKDTEQAHFALGVHSFPVGHPKHYAASVLSTILGGPMSSRLFIELRERRGLGYYVRCGLDEYVDAGTLVVQAGVQKPKIEEAIKLTLEEFSKIANTLVPEEELKRAKEYIKGKMILELEDSKEVSALYLLQEILEKRVRTPEEIISSIDSVTSDDVISVAKELLTPDSLNLAIIGPYKEEEKFLNLLEM